MQKSRIASILKANSLDSSVTGLPCFDLNNLSLKKDLNFQLPDNIRLGHLAEKVLSKTIEISENYEVLYENIQIIEAKKTIGEIDFILQETKTKEVFHVELAYKFYLYDPYLSPVPLHNWIGPNRRDSLKEKLDKLKEKQFPLLYHSSTKIALPNIEIKEVTQALCLLVNLYVPYENKTKLNLVYKKAIKGCYFNLDTFFNLHHPEKSYYFPPKKEWGMEASDNEIWFVLNEVEDFIRISIQEKQAPLCWQKHKGSYSTFFIVWWT